LIRVQYLKQENFNYRGIINRRIDSEYGYEGTLNGDIFLYFLENFLVPQLESGNVVICDNASHKVANVKELIGVNGKGGLSSTIFSRFVADRVVLVEI